MLKGLSKIQIACLSVGTCASLLILLGVLTGNSQLSIIGSVSGRFAGVLFSVALYNRLQFWMLLPLGIDIVSAVKNNMDLFWIALVIQSTIYRVQAWKIFTERNEHNNLLATTTVSTNTSPGK